MTQDARSHPVFMQAALDQARQAAALGEVPIGAVLVHDGVIIGVGHNSPRAARDPTAHAEIMALRAAARQLDNYRLQDCTLYVTLEPCTMCAGAMLHARLAEVIYALAEPKSGAAGSVINPFAEPRINHQTQVRSAASLGPQGQRWADDCAGLLQTFFRERRLLAKRSAQAAHPLRQDAVRAPSIGWQDWPDWQGGQHAASRFVSHLPSLEGLRLHYLEVCSGRSGLSWLLLHGHPGWSAGCTQTLERLLALPSTARVLVPDLIGFGLSDKPKKAAMHRPEWHRQVLAELVQFCDVENGVILAQGVGADLATALPAQAPERWRGFWGLPQGQRRPWPDPAAGAGPSYAPEPRVLAEIARRGLAASWRAAGPAGAGPGLPAGLLLAAWPDAGHQAAFAALATWYEAATAAAWRVSPGALGCRQADPAWLPPAQSAPLWATLDGMLADAPLSRAAACFSL
jgi:tRNA(adenine34) deaminase